MGCWGTLGAGAHKHSGVKQQVAQGGHPRESQRRGQQGSEAWLERQGTDRAREKLQKWAHPAFKQGVGLQPGSSEEDANVGKKAPGAGAQSGARRVALGARKPTGNLVEQPRSD